MLDAKTQTQLTMYGSSYGSYGSYSSMNSSSPLDIPTSSYLYAPGSNTHCAFPSWPRRDSLGESDHSAGQIRATSYLSDDDLMDPFEDDASSITSAGSSNVCSPIQHAPMTDEQVLKIQREREAMQREVARFILGEKERRKQASKEKKRRGSQKKSPKSKLAAMTPIAETGE
ncbi:hypothetical protein MKZ38_006233 [Zalerion maritima]|uniref:Uncharacterized protein n=1 Tax=Zalerion maritima TaxID=339359 RepID=A0AAD5RWQ5_9PEZI|nr:hypothetical protein MKZ38_006233 [Zalerion maritima]